MFEHLAAVQEQDKYMIFSDEKMVYGNWNTSSTLFFPSGDLFLD